MASYTSDKEEIGMMLYAMKGMVSEATPEQRQALDASLQILAEMLDTYSDMGKLALVMTTLELQLKEG